MPFPTETVASAVVTSTAVIAVAWPVIKPWVKRLVDARLDFEFAKKLESHKQALNVVTESAKYEFQKKLTNVSVHTAKRHEAYTESYRAARVAHGLILNQRGWQSRPTFEDYNAEDVVAYLRSLDAPSGFIEDIQVEWQDDRQSAIKSLKPYIRMLEMQAAENAFIASKNTIFTHELYFSEPVIAKASAFIDAGAAALADLKVDARASEWPKVREALTKALGGLHEAMRLELSSE